MAAVVDAGTAAEIVDHVAVLQRGAASEEEKADAAVGLGSIANLGHKAEQDAIVAAGAVPPLVALLKDGGNGREEGKEEAACALWKIAEDNNASARAAILEAGAVPPLVWMLQNGTDGDYGGKFCAKRVLEALGEDPEQLLSLMVKSAAKR